MREIIDVALRRHRTTVLVAVTVGLGSGLLSIWAGSVGGALELLTLFPPLLFLGALLRGLFRRPGTEGLRVDGSERAFFAPPRTALDVLPLLCGWFAYMGVDTAHRAVEDPLRWPFVVCYPVAAVLLIAAYWRRAPFVELTPEGVASGAPHPLVVVPWEALDRAAPLGSTPAFALRLPVARPDLVRRRGWGGTRRRVQLPVRELAVAPALLAAAIGHYAAHPEHRAAIGTHEEYARLRQALATGG
ncbi:hypothetical protein [Micromonospora sp. RTP1Z1]|uniref:hypothetical protein n=1 Tax=Micromonospora sp. RTP1Z1 TaxID=2994043 RepID=UPI0029C658EF|nr:hypothetical protein [Micromonospora sp. RTP1Z1]